MTTVGVANQLVPGQCDALWGRDQRDARIRRGRSQRQIISHGWQSQAGIHLSGLRVHHRLHLTIYHLIIMQNDRPTHLNQKSVFGPMVHLPVMLSPTPFQPGRERDGSEREI